VQIIGDNTKIINRNPEQGTTPVPCECLVNAGLVSWVRYLKKMKNLLIAITLAPLFFGCSTLQPKLQPKGTEPQDVSLIQLIASPLKYDGRFVRVEGYLHNKFEDSALYFSKDHADRLDGRNGVWVEYAENEKILLQPEKEDGTRYFDCKWVLLEGTFLYESELGHGHMGTFSGELRQVTRIIETTLWYDGERQLEK